MQIKLPESKMIFYSKEEKIITERLKSDEIILIDAERTILYRKFDWFCFFRILKEQKERNTFSLKKIKIASELASMVWDKNIDIVFFNGIFMKIDNNDRPILDEIIVIGYISDEETFGEEEDE